MLASNTQVAGTKDLSERVSLRNKVEITITLK